MSIISCRVARARLAAHHDDELTLDHQVALEAHLTRCPRCAALRDDLGLMRTALRTGSAASSAWDRAPSGLAPVVLGQVRAERHTGWRGRVVRVIELAPQLWIASGAVTVTTVSALIVASVLSLATPMHEDSMAGVLRTLASPGSNANPIAVTRGVTIPYVSHSSPLPAFLTRWVAMPSGSTVALAAVVTQEGALSHVKLLRGGAPDGDLQRDISRLVSDVRFMPARYGGVPVAVNVVWLLERTTVRAAPISSS